MLEAKKNHSPGRGASPEAPCQEHPGFPPPVSRNQPVDGPVLILPRSRVIRGQAGKVHESIQPAAIGARLAPIAAREVDHC